MSIGNLTNSKYLQQTRTPTPATDRAKREEKSSWKKPVLCTALAAAGVVGALLLTYRSGTDPSKPPELPKGDDLLKSGHFQRYSCLKNDGSQVYWDFDKTACPNPENPDSHIEPIEICISDKLCGTTDKRCVEEYTCNEMDDSWSLEKITVHTCRNEAITSDECDGFQFIPDPVLHTSTTTQTSSSTSEPTLIPKEQPAPSHSSEPLSPPRSQIAGYSKNKESQVIGYLKKDGSRVYWDSELNCYGVENLCRTICSSQKNLNGIDVLLCSRIKNLSLDALAAYACDMGPLSKDDCDHFVEIVLNQAKYKA